MLNLYSIFVYYVFFLSKKTPPLLPIFQLRWGVLPSLPPSVSAPAASHTRCCTALFAVQYRVLSVLFISTLHQKKRQVRPINLYRVGKNPKKILFFIFFRALWAQIGWGKRLQGGIFPSLPTLMAAPDMFYYYKYQT